MNPTSDTFDYKLPMITRGLRDESLLGYLFPGSLPKELAPHAVLYIETFSFGDCGVGYCERLIPTAEETE